MPGRLAEGERRLPRVLLLVAKLFHRLELGWQSPRKLL
jgi:hypothetical protein